ncbi:MAG: type II toxin-antitoxin system RelE/ParE family toxin [Actinomycetes bacterium]|jgi:putative addiction module killer protein|nr:type II toxin-antitoxin system RelE/ParE family toxin [Actinomycetes bacterium]
MFELLLTDECEKWIANLRDKSARTHVVAYLHKLSRGNLSDSKSLSNGLYELRIHYAKGYRVYYARRGKALLVILIGGTKQSQSRDIVKARKILETYDTEDGHETA